MFLTTYPLISLYTHNGDGTLQSVFTWHVVSQLKIVVIVIIAYQGNLMFMGAVHRSSLSINVQHDAAIHNLMFMGPCIAI